MPSIYQKRVAAGVDLLNRVNPGWEDRVNVDTLRMASCSKCVLGQLYGNFDYVLTIGHDVNYGFALGLATPMDRYDLLQREWIRQILALREEKKELRELGVESEEVLVLLGQV